MSNNLYESECVKEIRESLHWLSGAIQDTNTTDLLVRRYIGRKEKEDFSKKSLDSSLEIRKKMNEELKKIRSKLKELKGYENG